jgi:hypothetical protein
VRPSGGTGPCPDDMLKAPYLSDVCHLLPRKRLLDSEFDTHALVLSAVARKERGVV